MDKNHTAIHVCNGVLNMNIYDLQLGLSAPVNFNILTTLISFDPAEHNMKTEHKIKTY